MLDEIESTLTEQIDLPIWIASDPTFRMRKLQNLFEQVKNSLQLSSHLYFEMPPGFEMANGLSDPETGDIRINTELWKEQSAIEPLFYFLHELRHSIQSAKPNAFPPVFAVNTKYVFQFDGTAYKYTPDGMKTIKLSGSPQFFIELYLASPCERDANSFAYRILKACGADATLDRLFSMWSPRYSLFSEKEADSVFLQAVEQVDNLLDH